MGKFDYAKDNAKLQERNMKLFTALSSLCVAFDTVVEIGFDNLSEDIRQIVQKYREESDEVLAECVGRKKEEPWPTSVPKISVEKKIGYGKRKGIQEV